MMIMTSNSPNSICFQLLRSLQRIWVTKSSNNLYRKWIVACQLFHLSVNLNASWIISINWTWSTNRDLRSINCASLRLWSKTTYSWSRAWADQSLTWCGSLFAEDFKVISKKASRSEIRLKSAWDTLWWCWWWMSLRFWLGLTTLNRSTCSIWALTSMIHMQFIWRLIERYFIWRFPRKIY